jgi:uncharacterized protein (DUF1697 family)
MPSYLALIRGINVGGKNLIRMTDLRAAFEAMEVEDVATYIQTGNVFFDAPRQPRAELAARIESALEREFEVPLKVVLLTRRQLEKVVDGAPGGFGGPDHRCDVIFLRSPLTVAKAFPLLEMREGVDEAWRGPGVLYFSRLAAKASGSRLSKIVALPEYQEMTIRSWSTTSKLLGVMEER